MPALQLSQILTIVALGLFTFLLAWAAMGLFSFKNHLPVDGKTVLITGASEGMGRYVSLQLAAKGANLIVIARNTRRLEELVTELKAAAKNPSTQRFTYFVADISVPNYAEPLLAKATAWNGGKAPDIVWCVAGISTPAIFVDTPFEALRRNMDINFYGTAQLSHAILKVWLAPDAPVEEEPKHLIMTNSVLAFFTIVGYAPYSPSKWALRGLADTLSQEVMLYPQKVKIHVVYPGSMTSPGFEVENRTKPQITKMIEEMDPVFSPEDVATWSIQGLEKGQYFITVAFLGGLMKWGTLGGSMRNNWVIDTLMGYFVSIVWMFVLPDIWGKVRKYGKTHGHPSTYGTPKVEL